MGWPYQLLSYLFSTVFATHYLTISRNLERFETFQIETPCTVGNNFCSLKKCISLKCRNNIDSQMTDTTMSTKAVYNVDDVVVVFYLGCDKNSIRDFDTFAQIVSRHVIFFHSSSNK